MNHLPIWTLLAVCSVASLARAETDHRLAAAAANGVWVHPEKGMHLALILAYDVEGLPGGAHFGLSYNTDTFRLRLDRLSLLGGKLEAGVHATYEFKFAGLLIDYYRSGRRVAERGFEAGYLEGSAYLKLNLPANNYLSLTAGVRRWFFQTSDKTADEFILPPEAWVFEPRLSYTYWSLQADRSHRDRHRLYPRVRGLAIGVELGLDIRSQTQPWGAREASAFDPADPRNDPAGLILRVRQWLRAGWQLGDRIRTQIAQFASYGHGEDDLTRVRLGGLNPYVVPLAGAPWATFLADRFMAVESSWHFRIWDQLEAGPMLHGMLVADAKRLGQQDTYQFHGAVGVFVDWQLGDFQIDLRAGWSPTLDSQSSSGQLGLFGSAGWQWD